MTNSEQTHGAAESSQRAAVEAVRSLRRPQHPRAVAAAAVLLGFAAVVGAILAQPGGTLIGDDTTHVRIAEALEVRDRGVTVVQAVAATDARMAAVEVNFGTYYDTAECTLHVTVREDDGDATEARGAVVAQSERECSTLVDTLPTEVLSFEPVEESAGEIYDIVIERVDKGPGQGVVIWAGLPVDGTPGAVVGGQPSAWNADVRLLYDPQDYWISHVDDIATRLAAYGPAWGGPAAFACLIALVGLLLGALPVATRSPRALMVMFAALALARGLLWSAAVPPFGGMDEPAHFSNVQYLALEHELPGQASNSDTFSDQIETAAELLYVNATPPGDRPDYSPAAERATTAAVAASAASGGGGGPASAYPPAYYAPAAAFAGMAGGDLFAQVHAARIWSVLLGVLAAVLAVLTGRRLFPDSRVAQVAFAAAGVLQPMAGHQFAIVNNDAWVIAVGFGSLLVALELARRPRAPALAILSGALIGAALLGKPFGVAVAVPLAAGWLIGKVRGRVRSLRRLAAEAGLVGVGVATTYGLWLVVARLTAIEPQRIPALDHGALSLGQFARDQVSGLRWLWGGQFWGNFGWVRIPFDEPIPTIMFLVMVGIALGVLCWLVLLVRHAVLVRRRTAPPAPTAPAGESAIDHQPLPIDVRIAVSASFVAGMVVTVYSAAWIYFSSTGRDDLLQGRYGLLALTAVLALPGLLITRLTRGRVRAAVALVPLAVLLGVLQLVGLARVLEAFYG